LSQQPLAKKDTGNENEPNELKIEDLGTNEVKDNELKA